MAIFRFFKMAAAAILDFQNFKSLTTETVNGVDLQQRVKFRENRLNRGRNMAIFRFFKMAAAAILDFQYFKFLTAGTVKGVELHQRAKFRENQLNRGQNMAIFQDGGRRHLGFSKFQNFNGRDVQQGRIASACQIL